MKPQTFLVGIGSGLAALALLAAITTSTLFALPLFLLSALPIALAGFAFGPPAAAVGAIVAAVGAGLVAGPVAGIGVAVLIAGPMAWTIHLLSLSRPLTDGSREWYPPSRAFLQAIIITALGLAATGLLAGYDPEQFAAEVGPVLSDLLAEAGSSLSTAQVDRLVRAIVTVVPYTTAAITLTILTLGAWLGARLAEASGRLARPRTPLWTVSLPLWAVVAFGAAVALSLLPGQIGDVGAAMAGAFGFGFSLVGLAVIHALTRGMDIRGIVLGATYVLVFILGIALVLLAAIGIADSIIRFRSRQGRPPSPLAT